MTEVWLYDVGRNLARAYRTCSALGIQRLVLLRCRGRIEGNLYRARHTVDVVEANDWPDPAGTLALETHYTTSILEVDWSRVQRIILGGETSGLPRRVKVDQTAVIPSSLGLTVEAALAIALWEARRRG